jgi:hypothetical protein
VWGNFLKKQALTAILLATLLVSALAGVVRIAKADNPPVDTLITPAVITMLSPENSTYTSKNVTLSLSVNSGSIINSTLIQTLVDSGIYGRYIGPGKISYSLDIISVTYQVDDKEPVQLIGHRYMFASSLSFSLNLTDLTEGTHNLTVVAKEAIISFGYGTSSLSSSSSVTFTVDTVPSLSVLAPQNQIYNSTDIPLNFTVDQPVTKISYSLDGKKNMTITGNTTLNSVPNGRHNLTIYATDETGNVGVSEMFTFTVEAFPTTLVATAAIISVAVIGIGLLFYFKKRKQ